MNTYRTLMNVRAVGRCIFISYFITKNLIFFRVFEAIAEAGAALSLYTA